MTATSELPSARCSAGPLFISVTSPQPMMPQRIIPPRFPELPGGGVPLRRPPILVCPIDYFLEGGLRSSLLIFVGLCLCLAGPARGEARKPNVLLILADDLGYGDVGFHGRKEWKTPNLDRLSRQGTTFE